MGLERFTQADVDYLVGEAKFIRAIPALRSPNVRLASAGKIQAEVFKKSDPRNPVEGLIIMAKARPSPPGIPRPLPSSALEWHGKRIRGLNYEIWHDNPDTTIVKGWHEHIWSPRDQDSYVRPARPQPIRKGLLDIFKWGLKKWNIEVQQEQLEVPYGEYD